MGHGTQTSCLVLTALLVLSTAAIFSVFIFDFFALFSSPLAAGIGTTHTSPGLPEKHRAAPRTIVAVGDLHGDYENALKTLRMAGIVDASANWAGGDRIFVQTGDIVDRGDDTIKLYEMMIRIRGQAAEQGGKVVPLLGNHEVMNMQGSLSGSSVEDLRYVTPGDIKSFGGLQARKRAWSKDGWLGSYLRELGVAALVEGNVFFHGGAAVKWARETVEGMNEIAKDALDHLSPAQLWDVGLFGDDGPLWYRG
ncbi:hypothetical protein HDU91_005948, partial [Kappamyces sp. JEL0680]